MSEPSHYDLVVIGSGPAGEKGAAQAAYFGKKVALIERATFLGGAGLNTGTIPSKTLRESALYYSGLRQRGLYGIDYSLREGLTVREFMHRERAVVGQGRDSIALNLDRHGIDLVWGEASLLDPHTVRVALSGGGERTLTTEFVLIATGSSPHRPPEIPFGHPLIHDSDEILDIERIPKTLAVVGGGVIGVEYASVFAALGARVTLVEGRDRILSFVDAEIVKHLSRRLESIGLRQVLGARVDRVDTADDHVTLALSTGEQLRADLALFAAGRQSNIERLGLEALGVALGKRGLILVNEVYRTNLPSIYAAGDVIGFPALASTSMEQARVAMVHAFGLQYKERVSPVVPLAVYTVPEIAQAGLTEEGCRESQVPFLVGRASYNGNARGQIIGETEGMLKLVFAPADKRLLGVHLIGELASELVHIGAQVMGSNGTIDAFIDAVYNFPTLSDMYKYAAYDGLGALSRWQRGGGMP